MKFYLKFKCFIHENIIHQMAAILFRSQYVSFAGWLDHDHGIQSAILAHWPLGNLNEILDMKISNGFLVINGWGISCEIALK